ncbi:MAG: hypothetical protein EXS33_01315, partial [Pedosphaera sp.]|nr:hypothetical protein [Pedosphaera sp.]
PGVVNTNVATLPAFPSLWLNEVQAENINGPTNSAGQRTAWLELYNAGTNVITLTNLFLTGNYTNLTNWAFPAGATLAPGEFKIIFADGLTNLSTLSELHTSFALPPGSGSLALSRRFNGQPQVIDYLNYTAALGHSYGSFPDGQSFDRQEFYYVTPGSNNNAAAPPLLVFINEWMADNTSTLADPADNDLEDWFEIYNPGTGTADLSGFYLTDNLTNKFQYLIPPGYTIPPGGHLLVWADNETAQNSTNRIDLHVNFKLAADGEAIGLFAADGTQIDAITFGPQTPNISQGRYPDGTPNTPLMTTPTPRAANIGNGNGNTAPILTPIPSIKLNEGNLYTFTATANDTDVPAQTLSFTLSGQPAGATITTGGLFTWTPTEAQGPGVYNLSVIVADNGTPSLTHTQSFTLTVDEVNTAPTLTPIPGANVNAGALLTFTASATDPDLPAQILNFSLSAPPAGASITTGGLFTWTPTQNQAPGTNTIAVVVADNGLPSLTATQTFNVIIIPPPLNLTITRPNDTEVVLTWTALAGRSYRVEYIETVDAPANAWTPAGGPLTATTATLTYTATIAPNIQRFYRIRQLQP